MALVLPDLILVNTINRILTILRNDFNNHQLAGTPTRSILWLLFGGLELGRYNAYQNIVAAIVTTDQDPNVIRCKLSYEKNDTSEASQIYVTLPSESNKNNTLGLGQGNQDPLEIPGTPDTYKKQYNYRFLTTYQVMVTGPNRNEVMVLYHLIKTMLVATIEHMSHYGLSNMKIGGQDIRYQGIPDTFFMKAITLNFEYEQVIPEIDIQNVYRTLRLFWREDQAIVAKGPIVISVDDDIQSSSGS